MSGGQIATMIVVPFVLAWGAYGLFAVYRWISGRPVWPMRRRSTSLTARRGDSNGEDRSLGSE